MTYSNGDVYEGLWNNSVREGIGKYTYASGDFFQGEWVDDVVKGRGKIWFVKKNKLREEFLFNGAILRTACTHAFNDVASYENYTVDTGYISTNLHQALREWRDISSYIRSSTGSTIISAEDFNNWLAGAMQETSIIKSVLSFCEKWYLDLNETTLVPALPDYATGNVLSIRQVLMSSRLVVSLTRAYMVEPNDEKYELLRRTFRICLMGLESHHSTILDFLSNIPKTNTLARAVCEMIFRFKRVPLPQLSFLQQSIRVLESRVYQRENRVSPYTAITLLKLHKKEIKYVYFKTYKKRIIDTKSKLNLPNNERDLVEEFSENLIRAVGEETKYIVDRHVYFIENFTAHVRSPPKRLQSVINELLKVQGRSIEEKKRELGPMFMNEQNKIIAPSEKQTTSKQSSSVSNVVFGAFQSFFNWKKPEDELNSEEPSSPTPGRAPSGISNRHSTSFSVEPPTGVVVNDLRDELSVSYVDVNRNRRESVLGDIKIDQALFTTERKGSITRTDSMVGIQTMGLPPDVVPEGTSPISFISINSRLFNIATEYGFYLVPALVQTNIEQLQEMACNILESNELNFQMFQEDIPLQRECLGGLFSVINKYSIPSETLDNVISSTLYVLSKFSNTEEHDNIKGESLYFGLDKIFELVQQSPNLDIQRDSLEAIATISSGPENIREEVVGKYGMDTFLERLISGDSEEVRAAAARLVANLCYNEENKNLMVTTNGALKSLLEFTKQGQVQINNKIDEHELEYGRKLGQGTFAIVYEGTYREQTVAIKVFSESSLAFRLEDFFKEVAIMCILSHPHILHFEGACIERKRDAESVFMIVTEIMQRGSLKDMIANGPLPIEKVLKYGVHISRAMVYIHNVDIIHRDLKCDNVLINDDDVAKVADLGLAREIDIDNGMTLMAGTPKWEAPEVMVMKKGRRLYSTSADVYSFGMVLFEMVSGEEPFKDIHDIFELKKAVVDKNKRPKIPKKTPSHLQQVIKSCWDAKPSKRPTFAVLLEALTELQSRNFNKKK
eukprot:TRINITY_DN8480_c0_g1_i1.p1 TRINITY_DN8480_c0_g1~~TRINITY_DN8480_c0_g1_i1.p1  ORF type:complete len:1015 (-),score=236.17 TRINITY_DN8480_c0_g1_i1:28-3072(-)